MISTNLGASETNAKGNVDKEKQEMNEENQSSNDVDISQNTMIAEEPKPSQGSDPNIENMELIPKPIKKFGRQMGRPRYMQINRY